MPVVLDKSHNAARGGTEIMMLKLDKMLSERNPELYDKVLITRDLDLLRARGDKFGIYWAHAVPGDPGVVGNEVYTLSNSETRWKDMDHIVFVSEWQRKLFIDRYKFNEDDIKHTSVLRNAIEPIPVHTKPDGTIRLIYTSVPIRGLHILYNAFNAVSPHFPDVELEVYSSYKIYNMPERDKQFERVINALKEHPKINYHGTVSNEELKEALKNCHIFSYPSTFPETSCIALIEAMSAGLLCVHSSTGALPETSGGHTFMYPYVTEPQHNQVFANVLVETIKRYKQGVDLTQQKKYADETYNWEGRYAEWVELIQRNV